MKKKGGACASNQKPLSLVLKKSASLLMNSAEKNQSDI